MYTSLGLGNRCSIRSWHLIAEHSDSRFGGQAAFALGVRFRIQREAFQSLCAFFSGAFRCGQTAKGRVKVVDWLKTLENHTANLAGRNETATYNFNWLWTELDVYELRR